MSQKIDNLLRVSRAVQVDETTGKVDFVDNSGTPVPLKVEEIELDDINGDANYRTVIRKEGGVTKFVKIDRSTGVETAETPSGLYTDTEVDAMVDDIIAQIEALTTP